MKTPRLAALAGIAATAVAASFLAPTAIPADAAPSAGNPRAEAQQSANAWVRGHGAALERAAQDSFVRTATFDGDAGITWLRDTLLEQFADGRHPSAT